MSTTPSPQPNNAVTSRTIRCTRLSTVSRDLALPGRGGRLRPELLLENRNAPCSFFFAFVLSAFAGAAQAQVVTLNKGGFVLTYDCSIHSATATGYTLTADTGSARAHPASTGSGPAGEAASARPAPPPTPASRPAMTGAIW